MGKFIIEELFETGEHQATAITHFDSTSKFSADIEFKKIIIAISVFALSQSAKLIEATFTASVPWILPDDFGIHHEPTQEGFQKGLILVPDKDSEADRALIEKLGKSSTWLQTALTAARLLSLKVLPNDASDKSATLSQFLPNSATGRSTSLTSKRD
ncbi:hypothetical protein C8J56DRAFT_1057637 [Mycena floridula]|nr:hypothetical protein C8J56DRAFT_1057637 [Mycena floridula]